MKVKFLKLDLSSLPKLLDLGYSSEADFHLRGDTTYIVYGISMWRFVLHYLVIPENMSLPYWYPADLFEIVDTRLPPELFFRDFRDNDPSEREFLLGYKELIQDVSHDIGLMEREVNAIRIFLERKEEIENALLD